MFGRLFESDEDRINGIFEEEARRTGNPVNGTQYHVEAIATIRLDRGLVKEGAQSYMPVIRSEINALEDWDDVIESAHGWTRSKPKEYIIEYNVSVDISAENEYDVTERANEMCGIYTNIDITNIEENEY